MSEYAATIASILGRDDKPVGAGIVVDKKRILTCAHVVAASACLSGDKPKAPNAIIHVKVPHRRGGDTVLTAKVAEGGWIPIAKHPKYDEAEDIAMLELVEPRRIS